MLYSLGYIALLFISSACGWMPEEHRSMTNKTGFNLFDTATDHNSTDKRWLPGSGKIRGVNLGSLFVIEPWINSDEWSSMGCGEQHSEFDCVIHLGQMQANAVFQSHWGSWITQADIAQMQSYGLNTIRIPVGYWMLESLVYADSENFPQGGFSYLEQVCGWASDAGFYIIIDMHGAPGAQVSQNADTGQWASTPGFYVSWQYNRATQFLSWLTQNIHSNNNFRNVGMIGIVNEPVQIADTTATMRQTYYPNAFNAIRAAESAAGVSANNYLHIQAMNQNWGSGDPNQYLTDLYFAAYDDHRYLKWANVEVSQASYISTSCTDTDAGGNTPTVVGEFSLSVPDDVQWTAAWDPSTQQAFYKQWFAAQVMTYERTAIGWVFWTWKTQLGDYRWSYQDAVTAGVIPVNPEDVYSYGAC
ncbi:putative endo-beta-1,6-glucanase [Calycina marina]|uniref:glucan endo-1,6-beta-glucosidase n=1 Tax=Calycina marina TaxID=1763456 RepID=A0A9P7YUM0_9HELO|nr:putative endo-beta-1,6-glucanase [Calycina marina]